MHMINNQIRPYKSLSLVINKMVTFKLLKGDYHKHFYWKFQIKAYGVIVDVARCVHKHEPEEIVSENVVFWN